MVKRLVQLQFCLDEDEFCFISLKSIKNIVHLEVCKCQVITHLKGPVLQFR